MRYAIVVVLFLCAIVPCPASDGPLALTQEVESLIDTLQDENSRTLEEIKELRKKTKTLKDEPNKGDAEWAAIARAEALLAEIDAANAEADAKAEAKEVTKKVADLIGTTRPMTAVLFSNQDRNQFEVAADPNSADPTLGIINQEQSGSTAGILIAAEAPFAFPDHHGTIVPIGAWFGVNFSTGGGADISDVDLAAGLSVSFVSRARQEKILEKEATGLAEAARLLVGVIYGDVVELGPKDASSSLQVGDPYPLGADVPVQRSKDFAFAIGLGFRF